MTEGHRLIKSAKSARDGNVTEATIPDDVIILANRACHDCYDHKTSTWFDVRDIIARAILAERERATLAENERCAKIAEDNYSASGVSISDAIRGISSFKTVQRR